MANVNGAQCYVAVEGLSTVSSIGICNSGSECTTLKESAPATILCRPGNDIRDTIEMELHFVSGAIASTWMNTTSLSRRT